MGRCQGDFLSNFECGISSHRRNNEIGDVLWGCDVVKRSKLVCLGRAVLWKPLVWVHWGTKICHHCKKRQSAKLVQTWEHLFVDPQIFLKILFQLFISSCSFLSWNANLFKKLIWAGSVMGLTCTFPSSNSAYLGNLFLKRFLFVHIGCCLTITPWVVLWFPLKHVLSKTETTWTSWLPPSLFARLFEKLVQLLTTSTPELLRGKLPRSVQPLCLPRKVTLLFSRVVLESHNQFCLLCLLCSPTLGFSFRVLHALLRWLLCLLFLGCTLRRTRSHVCRSTNGGIGPAWSFFSGLAFAACWICWHERTSAAVLLGFCRSVPWADPSRHRRIQQVRILCFFGHVWQVEKDVHRTD